MKPTNSRTSLARCTARNASAAAKAAATARPPAAAAKARRPQRRLDPPRFRRRPDAPLPQTSASRIQPVSFPHRIRGHQCRRSRKLDAAITEVTPAVLAAAGLIRANDAPVAVLGEWRNQPRLQDHRCQVLRFRQGQDREGRRPGPSRPDGRAHLRFLIDDLWLVSSPPRPIHKSRIANRRSSHALRLHQLHENPELRSRIFYTLALLFVSRVGAHIPLPGLDPAPLQRFFTNRSAEPAARW